MNSCNPQLSDFPFPILLFSDIAATKKVLPPSVMCGEKEPGIEVQI